jgi:hypothetical protein
MDEQRIPQAHRRTTNTTIILTNEEYHNPIDRLCDCGIRRSFMGLWYCLFVYGLVVFFVRLWACGILCSSMGLWYSLFVYGLVVFFVRLWACGIPRSSLGLWYSLFVYGLVVFFEQRIPQAHNRTKNTSRP